MKLINISPEHDHKYKLRVILLDKCHYKTVKVLVKKDKKVKRDLKKDSIDTKNVIEYGKNLVGRKVKDGKDSGVIFKYDRNGPFHWYVRFDDPNRDDEAMNLNEIKSMLV